MTRLAWDERPYETGVDRGVFYPPNGEAEVWNGLTAVNESPSESEERTQYLDGIKYQRRRSVDSFSATVEAFTYPSSLLEYDDETHRLSPRTLSKEFGLSYRVMTEDGYKIHLVYNALARPTDRAYSYDTVSPFSWELTTRPTLIFNGKFSAHLVIDSSVAYPSTMAELEDLLYGSDAETPHLPTPEEIMAVFESNAILTVVDNGDGTWTATGPNEAITLLPNNLFTIDWPSAVWIDDTTYTISSL